ncbi:uncharacterized protein LOC135331836 isoform X2 [Halichondria panicea]
MRKCTSVLIDLVKSSLSTIGPAFFAEEYIGETTRDLIGPSSKTSDVERAQILVDLMTDQVRADPSMYMKFITLLEKEGPWVELFLKNIKQTYSSASLEFRLSMSCDERSDWLSGCGISATTVSHFKAQEVDGKTFVRLPVDRGSLSRELRCDVSAGSHNKLQPLLNQTKKVTSHSDSITSPGPSFCCPYCQKCTLEQYLSEGCPEATGKTLFPYLNTPALSDEDRSVLEATLTSDTLKMIELFALTDTAILQNLKADVTEVKNYVLGLVSSLGEEKYIAKLEKADTIPHIFVALWPYKSFLNHKIVNNIVTFFGSDEDKKIMEDYQIEFSRRCAFEIPCNKLPSSRKDQKILSVKLTSEGSSLRDAILAKETIVSIFGVKHWALCLCSIEKGCMCLRFFLSAKVFAQFFPPTVSQLASLCEAGISILEDVALTNIKSGQATTADSTPTVATCKDTMKSVTCYTTMATQQEMVCWTQWLKQNMAEVKQGNLPHLLQDSLHQRDKNFNWTATHAFAASSEYLGVKVMKLLLKSLGEEHQLLMKDKDGDIPIQSAIRSKAPKEIIELFFIIANELNVTNDMLCSRNRKNQTPLLSAFDHSHWVAVDLLLDVCVKCNKLPELTGVNAPSGLKSNTLLHRAFKRGNTKYFDIFLRVCNANDIEGDQLTAAVLIPNKKSETPWYYAFHLNSDKMFEKVLKMAKNNLPLTFLYTDPDSKSTMLHEAHRMGNDRRCQLLKDNGAIDTPDKNGLLPIDRNRNIVQEDNMPNIGPGEEGATSDTNYSSEINTEGGSTSGNEDMPQSESASFSLSSQSSYTGSVCYGEPEQCAN